MNIKISKTLLVLMISYLIAFYILKFIFPQVLLLQITSENVLNFGKFVESSPIYTIIFYVCTQFITFYLFISASKGSFKIDVKELISIFVAIIINYVITIYLSELMVHTSTSIMLLLALINKGKFKNTIISFVIYGYLSQFLFSIRGFGTIVGLINIASSFILGIECYVWLIILSLYFYLKGGNENGTCSTTVS